MPVVQLNRHRQEIDIQQIGFQPLLVGKREYLLPIVDRFAIAIAARLFPKAVSSPKPNQFGQDGFDAGAIALQQFGILKKH